jgi:SAM-dependent methyltransferase
VDTKRSLQQSVQQQFGAAAPLYAESWPHRNGPDLDAMLAGASPGPGDRVLDVGCGAGHTAFAFAARGAHVVALDLTEQMLEQTRTGARERGLANLEVRVGDAEALPFDAGVFDVVTSRLAAHHFPCAERFVAEAHRVLRPGGRLLLSDSISPEDDTLDTWLNAIELLRDPSHVRDHRVSDWTAMLAAAGFATSDPLGRFPCPLDVEVWTRRMGTPLAAREGLRALFEAAPREVRMALRIVPAAGGDGDAPTGGSWELEIAVLRAAR